MPPMRSQWKNIGHRDEKQIPPDEEVITSFMVVVTIGVSYRPVGWKKAADMEKLTAEVEMLKARLAKADAAKSKYHTDLKKTKRLLSKFEIRMEKLLAKKKNEKPVSVIEGIHSALDKLISSYYSKFHLKTLLKDICDAFWTWRSGATQDGFLEKSRSHLREHVFSP
jgi:hypothetical protein